MRIVNQARANRVAFGCGVRYDKGRAPAAFLAIRDQGSDHLSILEHERG